MMMMMMIVSLNKEIQEEDWTYSKTLVRFFRYLLSKQHHHDAGRCSDYGYKYFATSKGDKHVAMLRGSNNNNAVHKATYF